MRHVTVRENRVVKFSMLQSFLSLYWKAHLTVISVAHMVSKFHFLQGLSI